jgi:hypothetical protein
MPFNLGHDELDKREIKRAFVASSMEKAMNAVIRISL